MSTGRTKNVGARMHSEGRAVAERGWHPPIRWALRMLLLLVAGCGGPTSPSDQDIAWALGRTLPAPWSVVALQSLDGFSPDESGEVRARFVASVTATADTFEVIGRLGPASLVRPVVKKDSEHQVHGRYTLLPSDGEWSASFSIDDPTFVDGGLPRGSIPGPVILADSDEHYERERRSLRERGERLAKIDELRRARRLAEIEEWFAAARRRNGGAR